MNLRIATWNIGEDETKLDNKLDLESYEKIVKKIKELEIDIICFQEAITDNANIRNIKDYIADNTNLKFNSQLECEPSHINIGSMMGVVTCSKMPITKSRVVMFENPKLVYEKSKDEIRYSQDKGFIVTEIEGLSLMILNGHGIPFHGFKRDALEFLEIFQKTESEIIELIKKVDYYLIIGDLNYDGVEKIFPKISRLTKKIIKDKTSIHRSTGKELQLDYIMASEKIKVIHCETIKNDFDHKLCIADLNIK